MSTSSRVVAWLSRDSPTHGAYYWFRVALGLAFVVDAVLGVQHLASYLPRWGVQIAHIAVLDLLPSIDGAAAAVLLTLQGGAAALLALGPRTCWPRATVLLALTYGTLVLRNIERGQNHEYLFVMVLFWVALCPPRSLDEPGRPERQPLSTVLRWQLAFVYLFAGLAKLNSRFLGGEIVLEMGWLDALPFAPELEAAPSFAAAASVTVALGELLLAQLLWLPRTRGAALVVGVLLHGGILLAGPSPQIALFNAAVLAIYVLWLPASVLALLSRARRVLLPVPARVSRLWAAVPIAWGVGAWWVTDHYGALLAAGAPWAVATMGLLGLSWAVGWRVAAGAPPRGTPWPSVVAVLAVLGAAPAVMVSDPLTLTALDRLQRRFPDPAQAALANLAGMMPPPEPLQSSPRLQLVRALTPARPDLRVVASALESAPPLGEGGRRVDELRVEAELVMARGELQHRAHPAAAHRLTRLASFRPYRWDIHHELGVAHWELGDLDAARLDYERAVQLGAYPLSSMQQLVRLLVEREDRAAARAALRRARHRHHGDADALSHLKRLAEFWDLELDAP